MCESRCRQLLEGGGAPADVGLITDGGPCHLFLCRERAGEMAGEGEKCSTIEKVLGEGRSHGRQWRVREKWKENEGQQRR